MYILRGFKDFINVTMLKKNAENLGFLGSFPFTLRERSRMMRMSVHRKKLLADAVHGKNQIV